MRTRTNICFGVGYDGFIKHLKSYYGAGNINVIYSDLGRAERLCTELTKADYGIDMMHFGALNMRKKGFVIGIGDENAILAAVKNADNKFALYPDVVIPESFASKFGSVAEFNYFDERFCIDNQSFAMECYAGLFCAFTDALAVYYRELNEPYSDKGLRGALVAALKILVGGSDREEFVKETLRSSKCLSELICERGEGAFVASEMAYRMGGGTKNRLLCAYFLNRLLILFTKWNFRDMLIPTENSYNDGIGTMLNEGDLLLDGESMKIIANKIKFRIAEPDPGKLVEAMRLSVGADSLFTEIYERGIPEGLTGYGKT